MIKFVIVKKIYKTFPEEEEPKLVKTKKIAVCDYVTEASIICISLNDRYDNSLNYYLDSISDFDPYVSYKFDYESYEPSENDSDFLCF